MKKITTEFKLKLWQKLFLEILIYKDGSNYKFKPYENFHKKEEK